MRVFKEPKRRSRHFQRSNVERRNQRAEQVVAHQPAISFSISLQHPFNRAGGRTSNVGQKMKLSLRKILWNDWPALALAVAIPIIWIIAVVFPHIRSGAVFNPQIAMIASAACLILLIARILSIRAIWNSGVVTAGRVVAVRIIKDRGRFEYEYEVDGTKVIACRAVHKSKQVLDFRPGDSVTVAYDPANPQRSIVRELFSVANKQKARQAGK